MALSWVEKVLLARGKISPENINLFHMIDEPDEVVSLIKRGATRLAEFIQSKES